MTHVKIILEGTVEFDGSVDEWKRKPPDAFKDLLRPQAKAPPPHLKAVMIAMADAVQTKKSCVIEASTGIDAMKRDNWTVTVQYR